MTHEFDIAKTQLKVSRIFAPLMNSQDYSVSISTQAFNSCNDDCLSVSAYVHHKTEELNDEGKNISELTSFGVANYYSHKDNLARFREMKKFVKSIINK